MRLDGALVVAVTFASLGVAIVVYLWAALALSRVFAKLGEPAWKAWVPFANVVTLFQLGGFTGLWLISLFFPVVNVAGLVVLCFALHALNRQFGKGGAFTAFAILLFPVWASVLGFGRSLPLGGIPAAAAAALADSPFESRVAAMALSPVPPVATSGPLIQAHEPIIVDPPMVISDPWAPPAPVIAAVEVPTPVIEPVEMLAPDDELTIIKRRGPVFTLEADGIEPIRLTAPVVVVGRNPVASDDNAQLVVIADPSKTMSKTHARLVLADGMWLLTDLQSTNGSLVVDSSGTEIELEPGASAILSRSFTLGQFPLTLRRES
jgi:hypothetical protein